MAVVNVCQRFSLIIHACLLFRSLIWKCTVESYYRVIIISVLFWNIESGLTHNRFLVLIIGTLDIIYPNIVLLYEYYSNVLMLGSTTCHFFYGVRVLATYVYLWGYLLKAPSYLQVSYVYFRTTCFIQKFKLITLPWVIHFNVFINLFTWINTVLSL